MIMRKAVTIKIQQAVTARDGTPLEPGHIVETVQGTVFEVIHKEGKLFLKRPEGLYDLEPYMSSNIWIIGDVEKNSDLTPT